jgi:phosphoglycolate phosphatase-like HAD superfamily hydrolase
MTLPALHPRLAALPPQLIIFDKDGTLIDFHAMWGHWAIGLAERLERASGRPLASQLYERFAFDPATGRIAPEGHLAITPVAGLHALVIQLLQDNGLSAAEAEQVLAQAWYQPDPVALARPLADLSTLFNALRAYGLKIAIATSDDRSLTETTLENLGLAPLVDRLACADDGLPIKPEPDMILSICRDLAIPPAKTIMVGDNLVDLEMGRRAAAGLVIGVLSGLAAAQTLAPHADLLLPTVAHLLQHA